jgi:hypothetical protein
VVEELRQRPHAPGDDGARAQREAQVVELRARQVDRAQLSRHVPEHLDAPADRVGLGGEGGQQPVLVLRPALRDADLVAREPQGVEAVGIHLDPLQPAVQADAAQGAADVAVVDAADVVQADVELPLALAAEGLAAAARDVVLLADEHPTTVRGQVGAGAQPAQARSDDHDVPWGRHGDRYSR